MEHLAPNTQLSLGQSTEPGPLPIRTISANRFAAQNNIRPTRQPNPKGSRNQPSSMLRQSNRTNPIASASRSSRPQRHQDSGFVSHSHHPRTEQTQIPLAAEYRAVQSADTPNQCVIPVSPHSNRTNPNPATSGNRLSPNRRSIRNRPPFSLAQPEQNKPKPKRPPKIRQPAASPVPEEADQTKPKSI